MVRAKQSRRYERFRALLIARRRTAGLTQEALAKRLGRPQSFVAKIENGERRVDVVEFLELATAVGFAADEFIVELSRSR